MMQRTKKAKKADLILTSDWHIRSDNPVCRTDSILEAQENKIRFITELAQTHGALIFHAGDFFHRSKPSCSLLSWILPLVPPQFYSVYGNHDLPAHNYELRKESGLYLLERAGVIKTEGMDGFWGCDLSKVKGFEIAGRRILVLHKFVYQGVKPFPGIKGGMAAKILRDLPDFDLIITGDNHMTFVEEHKGRFLVNPGALTRQSADAIDFKPSVFLYYADTNTVERIYLPVNDSITREHLVKQEQRDERIQAFISGLNQEWDISSSFEKNLKTVEETGEVKPEILQIVHESIEEVNQN
jgi:DNA repair exonuclease SbcCD nuclease subunit